MIKICIIGTGQIGFDLLNKVMKLDFVEIIAFVGRRPCTKILPKNIFYSDNSINYFIENPKCCDVVFDCTDAFSAVINSKVFFEQGIKVIDLTPSNVGEFYIPNISSNLSSNSNINMVTCGGQASIPLLKYLNNKFEITYAEVITQINSESAGMATRINVDKYIELTELAIYKFINTPKCKVILNINPHVNTTMQTTVFLKITTPGLYNFDDFDDFINLIQIYIPNYKMIKPTLLTPNLLMAHVNIIGSSNVISNYSGNLDIINCAAIHALITCKNTSLIL
jgi:acetaldehyde dehydrogenase (acetylating)